MDVVDIVSSSSLRRIEGVASDQTGSDRGGGGGMGLLLQLKWRCLVVSLDMERGGAKARIASRLFIAAPPSHPFLGTKHTMEKTKLKLGSIIPSIDHALTKGCQEKILVIVRGMPMLDRLRLRSFSAGFKAETCSSTMSKSNCFVECIAKQALVRLVSR